MQLETAVHLVWQLHVCFEWQIKEIRDLAQLPNAVFHKERETLSPTVLPVGGNFIHLFLFTLTYKPCCAEPIPLRLSRT